MAYHYFAFHFFQRHWRTWHFQGGIVPDPADVDFGSRPAILRGAHIGAVAIRGAVLGSAVLRGAHIETAAILGALLTPATLRGAQRDADIRGRL